MIQIDPQQVEALAARDLNHKQIAQALSISPRSWRRRRKQDEQLAAAYEKGRARAVAEVESLAFRCALKAGEDPRYQRAMIFWLKSRAGWKESGIIEREPPAERPTRESILKRLQSLSIPS